MEGDDARPRLPRRADQCPGADSSGGPGVPIRCTEKGRRELAETNMALLQGTLDLLVLKTLMWGPRHGYAIAGWILDTSGEELRIEDGALYTALHRMEKRGWLASEWGLSENNRKAKYYRLTAAGRRQLAAESALWERYAAAVFRVLRTA